MKTNVVFFSLRTKTCFSTTWTRKIESKMRTSENCLLWLTKKLKFITLNRSKYAGILASILPPSLKMFFDHLDTKNGIKNANSGENVAALAGKKAELSYLKSIKIRRNPCLDPPSYESHPLVFQILLWRCFSTTWTRKTELKIRFNVLCSPRASQPTTEWGKNVLNRIKPKPILYSWLGPKIVEISQLFNYFMVVSPWNYFFAFLWCRNNSTLAKTNSCLFIIIFSEPHFLRISSRIHEQVERGGLLKSVLLLLNWIIVRKLDDYVMLCMALYASLSKTNYNISTWEY